MRTNIKKSLAAGFTLIEALVTVAILGIMASLLITAISNAAGDSAKMVSRQQQAAVQAALNAWISGDSNRVNVINATTGTAKPRTMEEIRTAYNAAATSLARLTLISPYLDEQTYSHLNSSTTAADKIRSDALTSTSQWISMPSWETGSYPQVLLLR